MTVVVVLLVVVLVLLLAVVLMLLLQRQREGGAEKMLQRQQAEQLQAFKLQREELAGNFQLQGQAVRETLAALGQEMQARFQGFQENIDKQRASQRELMEGLRQEMRARFAQFQESIDKQTASQQQRSQAQTESLALLGKSQQATLQQLGEGQQKTLEAFKANVRDLGEMQMKRFAEQNESLLALRKTTDEALREMRTMIENKLATLQEENAKKLEEMRVTVDEKLQSSVKDRFDHSFKLISGQLESVQKGLGEMQNLAHGVGDLKKVLSNVKTRGMLGEIQLGAILDDILTPEQYVRNARVDPNSREVVEFAVKMPGPESGDAALLLPIDSKFPVEDYHRLQQAYEQVGSVTPQELESAGKQFENAVKKAAKDIFTKYVKPPWTTDFALLFVPTEGLYAEVLQRPGLFESLRREFKVVVVGPSIVSALLSSLQMGFRTLAIQQRSNEVWELLRAVKTEFGKFGDAIATAKKRIMSVGTALEGAERRTRAIDRKLREVQELPLEQSQVILGNAVQNAILDADFEEEGAEEERGDDEEM